MKYAAIMPLILVLLIPAALPARMAARTSFDQGNEFYQRGEYEKAVDSYEKAIKDGGGGPYLHYNLGNALLRTGRLGPAIANYLRAKTSLPRDPDLRFNLEFARDMIKARPAEREKGPFTLAAEAITDFLSPNEWTMIVIVALWILLIMAGVYIAIPGSKFGEMAGWAALSALLVMALTLPFAWISVQRHYFTDRAVIVAEKVTVRSGPGDENAELFDLYEGIDVELGRREGDWRRVNTAGGLIGWVKSDTYLEIQSRAP